MSISDVTVLSPDTRVAAREPVLRALLWTAGADGMPFPSPGEYDPAELLDLALRHRLGPRFLARYRRERPAGLPPATVAALLADTREQEVRFQRHLAVARELTRLWQAEAGTDAPPLLFVKSFDLFALTGGDPGSVRHSRDLDLFASDPTRLAALMARHGCRGRILEPGFHEYATYFWDGTKIEIHGFWPVDRYPEGVWPAAYEGRLPSPDSSVWQGAGPQSFGDIPYQRLEYADLLPFVRRGTAPGTECLCVPGPTLGAFLIATHEFGNFLAAPFQRLTSVKLAHLAEADAMMHLTGFDPMAFRALAARAQAGEALRFTLTLLRDFFGRMPPVTPLDLGEDWLDSDALLPRSLAYGGVWAALQCPTDLLRPFNAARDLLPWLGARPLALSSKEESRAAPLSGTLAHRRPPGHADAVPVAVSLRRIPDDSNSSEEDAFEIRIALPPDLMPGERYEVFLHAGAYQDLRLRAVVVRRESNGPLSLADKDTSSTTVAEDTGYRLNLIAPGAQENAWRLRMVVPAFLTKKATCNGRVEMFLVQSRWSSPEREGQAADALTLLPLILTPAFRLHC